MKDKKLTMNIGIISFIIVFVILCLVTFAVLSLVSANSNLNMTNKSIEHTTEYYKISSKGEETLEKIDDKLYEIYQKSSSAKEYYDRLGVLTEEFSDLTVSDRLIRFSITENELKLTVEIEATYPGETLYKLKSHKVLPSSEWNPDQSIDIL